MLRLFQSIFAKESDETGPYPADLVAHAIDRAVEGTDPRLRALSGYQRRLRPAVIRAIDYVVELVRAMPPPAELTRRGYGITAGPSFVSGLEQAGFGLFFWGVFATSTPVILAPLIGKYLFRFDPAINLGCCGGARNSTAATRMIAEVAKSNVPMLGYTVPYAVGNTLLTGMAGAPVRVLMRCFPRSAPLLCPHKNRGQPTRAIRSPRSSWGDRRLVVEALPSTRSAGRETVETQVYRKTDVRDRIETLGHVTGAFEG